MRDYAEMAKALRYCANNSLEDCESCPRTNAHECNSKDMMLEEADAIEELLAAVQKWISVKERLPEVDERVLACVGIPGELSVWDGVRWNGEEWESEEEAAYDYWKTIDDPVTHWMPLPSPPKEET